MSFRPSFLKHGALVVVSALPLSLLTGCALGTIDPSGPVSSPVTVHANIGGTVHGGQQPIGYSQLQIVAVGTTGYGSQGTVLTTKLTSSTNQYYPGGSSGCNSTAVSVTHVSIDGGYATFTANNTMIVGQLVKINDGDGLAITGSTLPVTAATSTTFTVADTSDTGHGGDTGTASPICYNYPVSDQNGNFLITGDYTCSTGSSALIAITASGGNPGISPTTNNSAIALIAGLGTCGNPASTVIINELTTAATAFAMAQYYTTTFGVSATDTFGAPSTTQGQLGITNAANTIANLVNISTGTAVVTKTNTTASYGSVTVTPDSAKLNTIGDILAACINLTPSTACTTLFNDVVTTSGTVPTDTLQAAVYMALNPTSTNSNSSSSNIAALFGLASGYPQWVGLSAQPTDWTIGISYGLSTAGTGGGYPLNEPEWFAFDASGNLWILNYGSSNLAELSPTGVPLYSGGTTVVGSSTPYSIIVDPSGNVWTTNSYAATNNIGSAAPKQVVEYSSGGTYSEITTTNTPYALASDGKGNIFVLEGAANTVEEIASGATTVTTVNSTGLTLTKYSTIAVDSNYNLWITSGASNTSIYKIPYSSGSYGAPVAYTNTNLVEGEPLAIDGSNNIWVGNYSTTVPSVAKIPAATPTGGPQYAVTGATGSIEGVAIDGGGNAWISNYSTGTNGFYEVSSSGTELSPSTGFAHTTHDGKAIAVDPSGNVWIGGTGATTITQQLVELVGAAVPVVTPIAAGLPTTPGGTSTLGTKP